MGTLDSANQVISSSIPAVVNVNGRFVQPGDPAISVFDRGYLYGDSLYEVCRTYDGKYFAMKEHLERLEASAKLCHMTLGQSLKDYEREMNRTLDEFYAKNKRVEAYGRIIVTRGVGKIGFGKENVLTPTQFAVIVQPLNPPGPEQFKKGFHYWIADERIRNHPRALDPAMKSGNYLNSLLAFLEAADQGAGYDDALLCNGDGHLTEGTTFNIFYVRRGIVCTPPLDIGILDGITRRKVIDLAVDLGIEVRETRFPKERLFEANEVFMTSTIKEVFPVTRLNGKKVANGAPGPVTVKLAEAFRKIPK